MALLGTVGKDIVAAGQKSRIPDTSLAYVFDLLSRQIHSRLRTAVYLHALMKPRETALSKTKISRRVGGRSIELVLYIRRRDTGKIKLRDWEESLRVGLLLFGA